MLYEAGSSYLSASKGEYEHLPVLAISLKNETLIFEITMSGGWGGGVCCHVYVIL